MPTEINPAAGSTHVEPAVAKAKGPAIAEQPDALPASFAQQRLWFLDQLDPNSCLYNVPFALHLSGELKPEWLQSALDQLLVRHESLRTNFVGTSGQAVQQIHPHRSISISELDLRSLPNDQKQPKLTALLLRAAQRPFHLDRDLLIRATLVCLEETEHVLMLCLHHIICDEWSLRILFRELVAIYTALEKGATSELPDLPIQYADYALWQSERLQGPVLAKDLDYWKGQLGGQLPRLDLPVDHARAITAPGGRRAVHHLSPLVADGLRKLSREQNMTLFMTLLAGFKVLLARYTGQGQIVVGSPIAGRTRTETEDLIGFFVNTLVLRTDMSGDPTFLEVLRRIRESTLGAYEHQELPFDKLVQELQPERSASHMPFLQVVFSLEDHTPLNWPGLSVRELDVDTQTAKFDLTWTVRESGNELLVGVEYRASLFEASTIDRLMRHWEILLEAALANPNERIARLPLLAPKEREQQLVHWNATERSYPSDRTIAAVFEAQARQRPDAIAVRYGPLQLTYAELNRRANALGNQLQQLGIGPDDPVALLAEPSVHAIIGLLGTLKAGGAYLPLDTSYPPERLRMILEDANAPVLLTSTALESNFAGPKVKVLQLDALTDSATDGPESAAGPGSLAYVIYTSGSTGRPKGVEVTQRAVLRLVCNTDYVQIEAADRVGQASNIAFDAATFEIWGALLNGAALIGISRETVLRPQDLAAQLTRDRITTLFLTTALFNQVCLDAPHAFKTLKHLLFGGEAVDPNRVRDLLNQGPPKRLLHVYGPTEATTFATWHLVLDVPVEATTVPIGRPIANTQVYLLDASLQPVPIGAIGEVFVGGPGVARGYLHRPELTTERFIPDPFSREPGQQIYRTGDLGRLLEDGSIVFVGRRDHQVKVRGFRVELGEIETILASHPAVKEVAVLARLADTDKTQQLVAYVALKSEQHSLALSELKEFLRQKLPDYMIPAAWVVLDHLPLNANGKVDRHKLPPPHRDRANAPNSFQAPKNPIEEKLAAVWSEVLGIQRVGARDNFFDLGGHSLLAVRLFSDIEKVFGRKLPLASLFEAPTIEQLALRLQDEKPCSWPLLVDIQPQGTKPAFFWIHSLGGDGGGAFFYYRKLAQLLGPDQPSFGIRSPQEPFTDIPEMASHYITELLRFQPKGPYFLGGFCFGGIVAYEMACQLRERGCEVGLLTLLESAPPALKRGPARWYPDSAAFLASNLHYWLTDFCQRSPGELFERVQRKAKSLQNRLQRRWQRSAATPVAPELGELIDMAEYPRDYVRYAQAHWKALLRYLPRVFDGHVTLFRARKQPLLSLDSTLGWRHLAKAGVAVNVIPGTHERMLEEPNVHILAAELKACLVDAQSAWTEEPLSVDESSSGSGASALSNAVITSCSCSVIT